LFSFVFVLLLQFLWKNNDNKKWMLSLLKSGTIFTVTFLTVFSIYLWFTYDIGTNKEYLKVNLL